MLFHSLEFIFVFLPVVLVGFFAIARSGRPALCIAWLIAASFFFYGWWKWSLVWLLLASVTVNFAVGRLLAAHPRRAILAAGIAFNLGLLGWAKYAGFLALTVNAIAGTSFDFGDVVLPLAISFFTFQQIAYLVDVYHGLTREESFARYCLFVTFFPQLIAGPIVHHSETLPQFAKASTFRFDYDNFSVGMTIFAIGLVKKVVLADAMGLYADAVFNTATHGAPVTLIPAWAGTTAFGLEIYFDFSGYSDMAIGLARLFGIRLPLNFDSPYKAVNIIDFWRRWHITLSRFLRTYLYFPLGGNRKGVVRRYVNLMTVMLLGGLWHGAAWTFVVWGGLHGAYLVVNHGWRALRRTLGHDLDRPSWWGRGLSRLVTLMAVMFAWVLFRADTWGAATVMIEGLTGQNGMILPESYATRLGFLAPVMERVGWLFAAGPDVSIYPTRGILAQITAVLAVALFMPSTQQWMARFAPALNYRPGDAPAWLSRLRWRPGAVTGTAAAAAAFAAVLVLLQTESKEFIYFQF